MFRNVSNVNKRLETSLRSKTFPRSSYVQKYLFQISNSKQMSNVYHQIFTKSLHSLICEFQEKINESGKFEAFVAGKQGNAPQQRREFNISKSKCVNTFYPFCTILQKNKMTDMHTAALMADHFDKIQKLPNPIEGVPNFRCVPGYQVIKHFSFVISHVS